MKEATDDDRRFKETFERLERTMPDLLAGLKAGLADRFLGREFEAAAGAATAPLDPLVARLDPALIPDLSRKLDELVALGFAAPIGGRFLLSRRFAWRVVRWVPSRA